MGKCVDDNERILTMYRVEALRAKGFVIQRGRVRRRANSCWSLMLVVQNPDGHAELWHSSMISVRKVREFASVNAVLEYARRVGLQKVIIEPPAHPVNKVGWR